MCAIYALVVLVCSLPLPAPVGAQDVAAPPGEIAEILSVAVRTVPSGAELTVEASTPPRWTLRNQDDGGFVLRLPASRPAEGVTNLTVADGLVETVTIASQGDPDNPTTFISVRPRPEAECLGPAARRHARGPPLLERGSRRQLRGAIHRHRLPQHPALARGHDPGRLPGPRRTPHAARAAGRLGTGAPSLMDGRAGPRSTFSKRRRRPPSRARLRRAH